jgi:hypothetical protein
VSRCDRCRGRGSLFVDPYLWGRSDAATAPSVAKGEWDPAQERETPRPSAQGESKAWEDRKRPRAFLDLEIALQRLRDREPGLADVLHVVYWRDLDTSLGPRILERVDEAVTELERLWPRAGTIRLPASVLRNAIKSHPASSLRQVARELGVQRRVAQRLLAA